MKTIEEIYNALVKTLSENPRYRLGDKDEAVWDVLSEYDSLDLQVLCDAEGLDYCEENFMAQLEKDADALIG